MEYIDLVFLALDELIDDGFVQIASPSPQAFLEHVY
jgi:hypothetical protein